MNPAGTGALILGSKGIDMGAAGATFGVVGNSPTG